MGGFRGFGALAGPNAVSAATCTNFRFTLADVPSLLKGFLTGAVGDGEQWASAAQAPGSMEGKWSVKGGNAARSNQEPAWSYNAIWKVRDREGWVLATVWDRNVKIGTFIGRHVARTHRVEGLTFRNGKAYPQVLELTSEKQGASASFTMVTWACTTCPTCAPTGASYRGTYIEGTWLTQATPEGERLKNEFTQSAGGTQPDVWGGGGGGGGGQPPIAETSGGFPWLWVGLGVGALALGGVGIFVAKRRKAKRAAAATTTATAVTA